VAFESRRVERRLARTIYDATEARFCGSGRHRSKREGGPAWPARPALHAARVSKFVEVQHPNVGQVSQPAPQPRRQQRCARRARILRSKTLVKGSALGIP